MDNSLFPFLGGTDSVISPIQQAGNFFIMDSENLVSNPFQQSQAEVVSDFQKKISMTEKLTSVKNNQNEHYFNQIKVQMERDKMHALKLLHENTSKLRYEMKLLDLDKRKNEMELQKRLEPERDFSYEDMQISNSQKRLGTNIESFYLDRKMRYPVRIKSVKDIGATPTIRRARQALKEHGFQRPGDDQESLHGDRAQTAKTVSSSVTIQPLTREGPLHERRRNSRSAPVVLRSYDSQAKKEAASRFPDIKAGLEGSQLQPKPRPSNTHVKFAFHGLTVGGEEIKENLPRAQSFIRPSSMRPSVTISDSDEDDDDFPEGKIDLRAILFGKTVDPRDDQLSVKSHALSQATFTTQHSGSHWSPNLARRFAAVQPQQLTQEALQAETKAVQNKVDTFLKILEREKARLANGEDSESDHEDIDTSKVMFANSAGLRRTQIERPDSSKLKPKEEVFEEKPLEDTRQSHSKRNRKDAWKYIQGKPKDGRLRGTYNSQDLVLQYLAGPQSGHPQRSIIPLHSASRALRHTATFKMRKVVENLKKNRTRYEQHEVDLLKTKQDRVGSIGGGGDDGAPDDESDGKDDEE